MLTGYTGFLGRSLARVLKTERLSVRIILHRQTVTRRDFHEEADELLWGAIDNPEVIKKAVDGVQWVIHSAWKFSSESAQRPTMNETATKQLFRQSIEAGVERFAFISSVAVYGMHSKKESFINESSSLASGKDLAYIYPSEKIEIEQALRSCDRKDTKLGIFRPGPIFDESKSPIKKIIWIAGIPFAIGLGNGRNHMPFIHACDVADAVVKWLKNGQDNAVFNVTPTICMPHKDWYRNWGRVHGLDITPVFIRGSIIQLAALGIWLIKKMLGKSGKIDVSYAIATATRNLLYSNERAIEQLQWKPEATDRYLL